ncbi:hypothetical protein ACRAQ6_10560 [Erythrobacter sp. HA6-11]
MAVPSHAQGKISAEDLAAGIYPEDDIRNKPAVRRWMAEAEAVHKKRASQPPRKLESFEQRKERLFWLQWHEAIDKRLKRGTYGDAYTLSPKTRKMLFEAAKALRLEIDSWSP